MKKTIKTKARKLQVRKKEHGYEQDFYAWSLEQAKHLKKKEFHMLDFKHLVMEIESLGNSEKWALRNHLTIYFIHLLKTKYQPEKRTKSWDRSLKNSKKEVHIVLKENPSFKRFLPEYFKFSYEKACIEAEKETGLDIDTFPEECPWTIKEVLGE